MKSGIVAVAGRPNVGKSTLVNALCGEKVAITSDVPNTTRRRLFGVANGPDYQLALIDLPGFQRPLDASDGAHAGDGRHVARGRRRRSSGRRCSRPDRSGRPVRRAPRVRAREAGDHRAQQDRPAEAGPRHLAASDGREPRRLPRRPSRQREDEGRRRRAPRRPRPPPARRPHVLRARADDRPLARRARRGGDPREGAPAHPRGGSARDLRRGRGDRRSRRARGLYVETESQKGILVGKRGAMVREIGTRARPEVEALVGHPVFLELTVKVRPKWRRDPKLLERLGL